MVKKDAPPDDEPQSKERSKKERENPAERQRSFIRQRTAILRPHDEATGEASTLANAEREDGESLQQDAPPHTGERQELLARYRRRQRKK